MALFKLDNKGARDGWLDLVGVRVDILANNRRRGGRQERQEGRGPDHDCDSYCNKSTKREARTCCQVDLERTSVRHARAEPGAHGQLYSPRGLFAHYRVQAPLSSLQEQSNKRPGPPRPGQEARGPMSLSTRRGAMQAHARPVWAGRQIAFLGGRTKPHTSPVRVGDLLHPPRLQTNPPTMSDPFVCGAAQASTAPRKLVCTLSCRDLPHRVSWCPEKYWQTKMAWARPRLRVQRGCEIVGPLP